MNINTQKIPAFQNYTLKSTRDRMERQAKRDNQIAYFEQRKEKLKDMKADTIEKVEKKLELLQGYDDQIAAAKKEYNHSQMFHVLDEARERAEKIAKEAEKYAPKTAEERREEMAEEATGADENEGNLSDMLDELADTAEDMQETLENEMDEMAENIEEQLSKELSLQESDDMKAIISEGDNGEYLKEKVQRKYKRVDIRI